MNRSTLAGLNYLHIVLLLGVAGLIVFTVVYPVPFLSGPREPLPLSKPTPSPPPPRTETVPPTDTPTPTASPTAAPTPELPAELPTEAAPATASEEDDFTRGWVCESFIGDIVEMRFPDGRTMQVRLEKPFTAPGGEEVVVTEISSDMESALVERKTDGREFRVSTRVTVDVTTIKPAKVEAYLYSVNEMESLSESVEKPVLNGETPGRYIFAHAPSTVRLNLLGAYSHFRATGYLGPGCGQVNFAIKADGTTIFVSEPVPPSKSVPIEVPLPPGTGVLELVVDPMGSRDCDHSFWLNPVLDT